LILGLLILVDPQSQHSIKVCCHLQEVSSI